MPQIANDLSKQFLSFVQQQALTQRENDAPPESLEQWQKKRARLRKSLIQSWGGFPDEHCPLEPRILGTFKRDGYRVEKLTLQTRPGIWMTANAYVPDGPGPHAAVVSVHGHWKMAKSEPVVQSRCIGLAKLGFFVLMVDAFGAGERGLGKALGEYHGEMVAGTLWPTGLALAGVQVYENMRAVDYLQSRPEVDGENIGITGTSGGGNQSMNAGAIEERFKCVVPACSVGTYQAYLGAACCMCEVTPNALTFTEESGVLSLVAPRALMLINATRDAHQFSVGEAAKSLAAAKPVFSLYGVENNARHAIFESNHDYNQPMREAMYGWMTLHLKGEGDGSPIPEPELKIEEAETLRCFPGESRPDAFVTLPQFAASVARGIVEMRPLPKHAEHWESEETLMRESLPRILGGFPQSSPLDIKTSSARNSTKTLTFSPEPGITVQARCHDAEADESRLALVLDLDSGQAAMESELAESMHAKGWSVVTADLRGTGSTAYRSDKIGRAADHNTAEWSMWIGRPLLGQWVYDVRRLLDAIRESSGSLPDRISVVGVGPASLVALCVSALDDRVSDVVTVGGLGSYVSEVPYENQRLGIMVPGILKRIGDVQRIAALSAPRRLIVAGGVSGGGTALKLNELKAAYSHTESVYKLKAAARRFSILADDDLESIIDHLS